MATLIKDISTFKEVVGGVQQSIEWDTIKGIVRTAEMLFILPVLGDEFYEELANYSNNNAYVKNLISRLQQASGYYTYAMAIPQMVASFGDGGITVNAQGGGQAVAKWMNVQMIESSMGLADKALENAIQYLNKYKNQVVSTFDDDFSEEFDDSLDLPVGDKYLFGTWLNSETYKVSKSLFISSATILTEHFPVVKGSHRVFLSMLQYLKRAEKTFILPIIGKDFFDSLKLRLSDDSDELTNEEETVIELIRTALAHKAFSMGIPYLNFNGDFQLVSETDGVKNQDAATRGKLDGMKVDCDENAKIFANKLKSYIDSVASDTTFSAYFDSPMYVPSITNKPYQRKPIDSNKPFVSF